MNASAELLTRIAVEARGTSPHALIIDYLREKRREMLDGLSAVPDDELQTFRARVVQIEEIIRDLTRAPKDIKPVKTGAYTV